MITAQEAYRIELVNEIVPAADLITRAEAILRKIASNAPIAVRFALEAANKEAETSQSAGLLLEASYFGLCAVRGPQDVINDPQLRFNDIVVPLEGAAAS